MNQDKALAILKSGQNVFLTGSAGAGKTYVLNQYIKYLKERKVGMAITASTGIAATHINGQTIHSWSGMGIKDSISNAQLRDLGKKQYIKKNMENVSVLIVDEISMLHKRQLEMLNDILMFFKENIEPFGGVQVIFSGDFFQLPPISREEQADKDKFCFMARAWTEAKLTVCYLTQQFRQNDLDFNGILNEIRSRSLSKKSIRSLEETMYNQQTIATKLYTHNADVDRINTEHLLELSSDLFTFHATATGNPNMFEMLKKSILAPEILQIKIGAKVMLVRNNFDKGYSNGTLGKVEDITEDEEGNEFPIIKTLDGKKIYLEKETWSIENEMGKTLASFEQFPLRLAWAITVHKSQGMTLDEAEVDLSKTFETGQGYVALSRVKSLDGLKLIGHNEYSYVLNDLAFKADKRFQELSEHSDTQQDISYLETFFDNFIKKCGGLTDAEEIEKYNRKRASKKNKKSTYLQTKELIEKGLELEKIAKERGLTKGTIIGHLLKLVETNPDLNISKLKPDDGVIEDIHSAVTSLSKDKTNLYQDGTIKSSPIYNYFNKQFSYDEIKLALLFIERNE
jgi:hypothetical protein